MKLTVKQAGFGCLGLLILGIIGLTAISSSSDQVASERIEVNPRPTTIIASPTPTSTLTPTPSSLPSFSPSPTLSPTPTATVKKIETPKATPSQATQKSSAEQTQSPNISSGGDKNCKDFKTHAEAQAYFESKGGSKTNNVDKLDGSDRDGIVCENLPKN